MAEVGGKRPRDGPRVKNDRVCYRGELRENETNGVIDCVTDGQGLRPDEDKYS